MHVQLAWSVAVVHVTGKVTSVRSSHSIYLHAKLAIEAAFQSLTCFINSNITVHCGLQAFPNLLQRVHQAADMLDGLRKQGPVDIKDVASRLTAGPFSLCMMASCNSHNRGNECIYYQPASGTNCNQNSNAYTLHVPARSTMPVR